MMKVCSQVKSLNKFELSAHSFSRLEGKRSLWALNSSIVRGNTSQYSWDLLYHLAKITKIMLTDVSEIERRRSEVAESSRVGTTQVSEVRRNRPKSDGTVRNQTEAFGIGRKCPKSDGGFVRNQRFVSPFSLLANRKKTQKIEQYYRYQLNTCNNGERHNKHVSQIY